MCLARAAHIGQQSPLTPPPPPPPKLLVIASHPGQSSSSALCFWLAGLDYMRPEYERLQQVDTVQCIWRQPTPHSQDFEDNTLQNCQAVCAMRGMYEQQLFTDATILVQGQQLHVHRAVLAAVSPVFQRMFSSQMQEGGTPSLGPLHKNKRPSSKTRPLHLCSNC